MIRKAIYLVMIWQMIPLSAQITFAEDYSECKARCAEESADCLSEPQASEPEVQVAKEAACMQKAESCNAECENVKPRDEEIAPPYNPNIIIR